MKKLTSLEKAVDQFQGCWNVYIYDFNENKIKPYNCLNHKGFIDQIAQECLEGLTLDDPKFTERVDSCARYFFWSKCEWELLVAGWPPTKNRDEEIKIDCYDQLHLNWDQFIQYLKECIIQAGWYNFKIGRNK